MKVTYKDSLEYKVIQQLNRMHSNVVLRRNFEGLGSSYSQTTRVLEKLIAEKKLVRIGFGIYAKAVSSKYTEKPMIKGGIDAAFTSALKKLGVAFDRSSAEKEYAAGRTMQIPAKKMVKLMSRCRRHIGYGNALLLFEKNINAK
jgi:hypothetical protein